jgi:hypothetical protein
MATHTHEAPNLQVMQFSECKMVHDFPPISFEGMALLAQAYYIRDPHEVLLAEFGDVIRRFSYHYADGIEARVRQFVVNNTWSAVGIGDHVKFDIPHRMMVTEGNLNEMGQVNMQCYGIDELHDAMITHLLARDELKARSSFNMFRRRMTKETAVNQADHWIFNTYFPQVDEYMERAYAYGYSADISNPMEEVRNILSRAWSFYQAVDGENHTITEVGWGGGNMVSFASDTMLWDPTIGSVLWEACKKKGTMNGLPLRQDSIPWDIFPVDGEG